MGTRFYSLRKMQKIINVVNFILSLFIARVESTRIPRFSKRIETCFSDECWMYDFIEERCVPRNTPQCIKLVCYHDRLEAIFSEKLFPAPDASGRYSFSHKQSHCNPVWNSNRQEWKLERRLGACDVDLVETTNDKLIYKTMVSQSHSVISKFGLFFETGDNLSVGLTCKYSSETEVSADAIKIEQKPDIHGATEEHGDLGAGIRLEYFTDGTYSKKLRDAVNLGGRLFAKASWYGRKSKDLRYFVKTCQVKSLWFFHAVEVISDTCLSNILGAKSHEKSGTTLVERDFRFSYRSFSFSRLVHDQQELICTIDFCLVKKDGSSDCDEKIVESQNSCKDRDEIAHFQKMT